MTSKIIDLDHDTKLDAVNVRDVSATGITAISKAAAAVVTVANNFEIGDTVVFGLCEGMTEINGVAGVVSAASATAFTVGIASTGFTTYTGTAGAAYIANTANRAARLVFNNDLTVEDNKKDQIVMAAKRGLEKLIEYLSDLT
jgi:hypothetical protein